MSKEKKTKVAKAPKQITGKKLSGPERWYPERFIIQLVKQTRKGQVTINYLERNSNGGFDKKKFTSPEKPRPEFERHLQSLATNIPEILEIGNADYSLGVTITSATFGEQDDNMTLSLTCEREMAGMEHPQSFRTNAKPVAAQELSRHLCLSTDCTEKAEYVWNEAVHFILGERSQLTLEMDDDERELLNDMEVTPKGVKFNRKEIEAIANGQEIED